jgi:hypothetical protein
MALLLIQHALRPLYSLPTKIRKNDTCIRTIYTIDVFPKYTDIHEQASPSIAIH